MRRLAAVLALLVLAGSPPGAGAQDDDPLLPLARQVRERGCPGHPGTDAPLRRSAALDRAAARMHRGEPPQQSAEREGYRLTRIFHASFGGYRSAADVAKALASNYCGAVTEGRFMDFGFHRRGNQWTVVLGAPLELPQLADRRAVVRQVLALTNEARSRPRRCGDQSFAAAGALQWDEQLAQAAERHAQDMAGNAFLDHRGRDGSTPAQRISRAGYRWRSVGENVAAGQPSAQDVVEDWLASPGHCANLMNPAFTELGVAFAVNLKAREAVYWAQAFGRPR